MKQIFLSLALMTAAGMSAQLTVTGTDAVELKPESSSGLNTVYVLRDASAARFEYRTPLGQGVSVQRFSSLGGGFAEDVPGLKVNSDGNGKLVHSWPAGSEDMGYIITESGRQICIWACNYALRPYTVTDIIPAENDCDRIRFNIVGSAPEMCYYSINGRRIGIDREIKLDYYTLVYDASEKIYRHTASSRAISYADGYILAPAPLCDTEYVLHPGRFGSLWGGRDALSPSVMAYAVQAETSAVQTPRDADNEQKVESESLGGSAPCEITFSAAVTDAAIYRRWEIASTPDFIDTYLTYDQLEFTHTFTEAGTSYVRFTANNTDGTCEYTGDTYQISIGESRLECPNAFTPGTSEGVNDEWKVSYKSIVSFHCEIFNRWGQKLCTLTDPSQGWDGKYGGKVVGSGVYFYVIKARGADGKDYKLSGDINIIGSRRNTSSGVTNPDL